MIAGIDPGLNGAICFLADRDIEVFDLPVLQVERGGKARRQLDLHTLLTMIESRRPGLDHVFVEQAQAMPKQSAYATGIFFQGYGEIRGILVGCRVPFTVVHPRTWKQAMRVPAGKDGARARASELLPGAKHRWPRAGHDGRAEAAMITLWGERQLGIGNVAA